jgi:Cysteine-rich CPCC
VDDDLGWYPCPCCGYVTLEEERPGYWAICRICRWEDDAGQLRNPLLEGGANNPSLLHAQRHYAETGASQPRRAARATAPLPTDVQDPGWRPLDVERDLGRPMEHEPWPADQSVFYWWRPTYWRTDDRWRN